MQDGLCFPKPLALSPGFGVRVCIYTALRSQAFLSKGFQGLECHDRTASKGARGDAAQGLPLLPKLATAELRRGRNPLYLATPVSVLPLPSQEEDWNSLLASFLG